MSITISLLILKYNFFLGKKIYLFICLFVFKWAWTWDLEMGNRLGYFLGDLSVFIQGHYWQTKKPSFFFQSFYFFSFVIFISFNYSFNLKKNSILLTFSKNQFNEVTSYHSDHALLSISASGKLCHCLWWDF